MQSTLLITGNCFFFRSFLRKNVKIMPLVLQIWRLVATWFFLPGKLVSLALLLILLFEIQNFHYVRSWLTLNKSEF